ncbi:MAG: hypothetical protein JST92_06495 [Deltaproteobacteria bacterium]|nr:hypothetical protein [Deltaproteobacteria bacterium]
MKRPDESAAAFDCIDGSRILLHPSAQAQLYFAEFRIQFAAMSDGSVSFGLLPRVISFCRSHGGSAKALRNGSVLSPETIMSDVFWSAAFRKATHLATHPRDRTASADEGDDP